MGTTDDSLPRAPRGSTRDASRSKRSRSHSRSVSTSSRSSRARSRSRSRERSSRSRRSRSASPSRRSRHSSRRRRRSRSRSTSRDRRGSGGRHRGHSRRHRDRDRDRRTGSSRKRNRSRSRSAEGRRRSRRDSSPRDDRRQRRRHESDVMPTEIATTVATLAPPAVPAKGQEEPKNEHVRQQVNGKEGAEADEKHDTPTSQESLATTTASTAASSQSDVEVPSNVSSAREVASTKDEHESGLPSATTTKNVVLPAKVDVKSIKMDILKALADARSTIAGIKGAAPPSAVATNAPKVTSPVQRNGPDVHEKAPEDSSPEEKASLPQASEIDYKIEQSALTPRPATAEKPMSPQNPPVSAADVDEFDMFSAAEQHVAGLPLSPAAAPAAMVVGTAIQSNYDDADGYYKPSVGEILHGEYRVLGTVGKGVFSTVLRCQRMSSTSTSADPEIVAIKLIRNNDIMREAAQTEIKILTHLSERDPRDKKHCVRLLDRFEHRNHVALVFESMQMNVREAMKKFGGKGGISIQAVRIFCRHLLVALSHLDSSGIVHADIKPDNVLLDEKQTMIKLCDFGSAFESNNGKHDPTPYLVSRFYRAPEIVLGLPYDKAVDMWSVGCCLYEMFTGKVMFPGATNNEMLKLFMELKGKVPNKIIKKHRQAYIEQFQMEPHFTEDNKFCSHELDRVTGKPVLRLMDAMKTRFDLSNALLSAKSSTDDRKQVLELRNLLERMFTLDASKRITPKEALAHPFVKTEGKQAV